MTAGSFCDRTFKINIENLGEPVKENHDRKKMLSG
jgi:hypothetical protein